MQASSCGCSRSGKGGPVLGHIPHAAKQRHPSALSPDARAAGAANQAGVAGVFPGYAESGEFSPDLRAGALNKEFRTPVGLAPRCLSGEEGEGGEEVGRSSVAGRESTKERRNTNMFARQSRRAEGAQQGSPGIKVPVPSPVPSPVPQPAEWFRECLCLPWRHEGPGSLVHDCHWGRDICDPMAPHCPHSSGHCNLRALPKWRRSLTGGTWGQADRLRHHPPTQS